MMENKGIGVRKLRVSALAAHSDYSSGSYVKLDLARGFIEISIRMRRRLNMSCGVAIKHGRLAT